MLPCGRPQPVWRPAAARPGPTPRPQAGARPRDLQTYAPITRRVCDSRRLRHDGHRAGRVVQCRVGDPAELQPEVPFASFGSDDQEVGTV